MFRLMRKSALLMVPILALTLMMAFAPPASPVSAALDQPTLVGVASCAEPDGSFTITWTLSNEDSGSAMTVVDTRLIDGNVAPDPAFPSPVPSNGESTATTTYNAAGAAAVVFPITLEVDVDEVSGEDLDTVISNNVLAPVDCDVLGSITIIVDANGAGTLDFDFDFYSDGPVPVGFNLDNDESRTFANLDADDYLIDTLGAPGWQLVDIDCYTAGTSDDSISDGDVRVHLDAGEDADCLFVFTKIPATATATAVPATPVPAVPTAVPAAPVAPVTQPITVTQNVTVPPATSAGAVVGIPVVVNPVVVSPQVTAPVAAPVAPVIAPIYSGTIKAPNTGGGGLLN